MSGASDDVKDKSAVLRNEQQLRKGTYFSQAQIDADEDRGGRYASLNKPTVTGTDPSVSYPRLPADAPSNQLTAMPDEPPLNYRIDDQECVGEQFEIQASLASAAPDAAVAPRSSGGGGGVGVTPKMRRRI